MKANMSLSRISASCSAGAARERWRLKVQEEKPTNAHFPLTQTILQNWVEKVKRKLTTNTPFNLLHRDKMVP